MLWSRYWTQSFGPFPRKLDIKFIHCSFLIGVGGGGGGVVDDDEGNKLELAIR